MEGVAKDGVDGVVGRMGAALMLQELVLVVARKWARRADALRATRFGVRRQPHRRREALGAVRTAQLQRRVVRSPVAAQVRLGREGARTVGASEQRPVDVVRRVQVVLSSSVGKFLKNVQSNWVIPKFDNNDYLIGNIHSVHTHYVGVLKESS